MAIVYSPNVLEIAVVQSYAGRPCVNVWHMFFDPEAGSDDAIAVVEDFRDNWQDHFSGMQNDNLSYVSFDWRSLDPGNAANGTIAPNASKPQGGTNATEGMPPNVAALVHKRTPNRPRGRRDGRSYIAGIAEAAVGENGAWLSANYNVNQASITDFYNGISDSSVNWAGDRYPVVLETTPESRAPGSASVTIGSRRVTSLVLDPVVATQRDRLR